MIALTAAVALLLAASIQDPVAEPRGISVQLGVSLTADTVTVGERFIAVIRVRVPKGASVKFPQADTSANVPVTATAVVGAPVIESLDDSTAVTMSAAYRLAAWDVGQQPLGLGDIVVVAGSDTGYVSLAGRTVFVRSVLPADSTLHVPKPPRAAFGIAAFDWTPLLIAALVIAAAMLAWRLWIWYRRRSRLLDPYSVAEREFARIEAMQLIASGQPGLHAALMSDVLRDYLAARVDGIDRSHTSSELLANSHEIQSGAQGLGELLWRTDLVKFANHSVDEMEAERLGLSAREITRAVERSLIEREEESERRAA